MTAINKQWLPLISSGRASSLKMDIKADEAVMEAVAEQYHQAHGGVSRRPVKNKKKNRLMDINLLFSLKKKIYIQIFRRIFVD